MDVDSVEVCDTGDEDLDNTPRAPRGRNLGDAWIQYKARLLGHLSLSGLSPEEVRNIKDASAKSKKDQQLLLHLIEAFGVSFIRRKNPDMATNMSGLQAWDKLIDEMERKNCANALRVLNNFGSMLLPGSLDAALRSPETGTLWCQDLQKVAEHARLQELNPLTIMCTIAMGKLYQTCGLDVASVLPVDDREAFGPKDLENHVKKLSARYKEGSRSSSLMYEEDADGVATLEQETIQEHTPISKQETKSKQETDSKQETTSEKETGTEAKAVSEKKATSEEKATLEEKATSEEKTIPPACSQCGGEHHVEKCTGRGDTVWCEFCKQGTHSPEACTRQESLLVSPSPQQTKASSNDAKTQETDTGEVAKRTETSYILKTTILGIKMGFVTVSANDALHIDYCHCDACTRTSGSPTVPWATVQAEGCNVKGSTLREFQSSVRGKRTFCAKCGSTISFAMADESEVDLAVGILDACREKRMRPNSHIFTYNRISWAGTIDTEVPVREDAVAQEKELSSERGSSELIRSDEEVTGRCLCGGTQVTAVGPPTNVCWCHCTSCQKTSGGPAIVFASWPSDRVAGVDKDVLSAYRHSGEFERRFCATCGSLVSGHTPSKPEKTWLIVTILDEPGRTPPAFHQFTTSALPWLRVRDGLHKFPRGAEAASSLDLEPDQEPESTG
ncbi:Hypothetical Protein FCC1311_085432 [Hondaea fermentalgiana]|uniref:CENP-V/GFA domain-containing protein n=1 Tax=Hondaea fermentalgiana TaxID=2315210 RepID=A0A2R5GRD0_9STRA|nr:Hypothetical Protein FCC1311_085432 [Hondaea fermentalgiana]|eukprot:GBG32318.1 Hypothetical Protein FCC1311_085432 [Hondaea fermentalgiana]